MKKLFFVLTVCVCGAMLSSCYNTRMLVGDVSRTEPLVEVNRVWNHGLIYGLVPLDNATMKVEEFTNNAPNYVVKTNQSFLNGLVSGITCGIYTPTTTTYYVPIKDMGK